MIKLTDGRISFLDPLFRFLNYFDSIYFFFFLVPLLWVGFSYQWGIRIFYWFSLNGFVIHLAKHMFGWPRPSTDLPELGMFHPITNGFPSGAATIAMFLGTLLIYQFRTRLAWVVGVICILLVSFSRLYLGVHYPLDILGGWVLAWVMLFILVGSKNPIENWLKKKGLRFCLMLSTGIPLVLLFAFSNPQIYFVMGSCIAVGLGIYFSLKHDLYLPKPKTLIEGFGRSFVGILLLFLVFFLIPGKESFSKGFLIGLFMSLVPSPICKKFMKKKLK